MQAFGAGGATAFAFQFLKGGEWNRWLSVALAIAAAFATGYTTGGSLDTGAQAAVAALAVHSSMLQGTPIGKALQQHGLPRILLLIADLTKSLAEAIETKRNGTPPTA